MPGVPRPKGSEIRFRRKRFRERGKALGQRSRRLGLHRLPRRHPRFSPSQAGQKGGMLGMSRAGGQRRARKHPRRARGGELHEVPWNGARGASRRQTRPATMRFVPRRGTERFSFERPRRRGDQGGSAKPELPDLPWRRAPDSDGAGSAVAGGEEEPAGNLRVLPRRSTISRQTSDSFRAPRGEL
jgi:hypothetical protein